MNNNPPNKTEKELLDEAMAKWPEELEHFVEEISNKDSFSVNRISSIEEFREYFETCVLWEEYRKNWLT